MPEPWEQTDDEIAKETDDLRAERDAAHALAAPLFARMMELEAPELEPQAEAIPDDSGRPSRRSAPPEILFRSRARVDAMQLPASSGASQSLPPSRVLPSTWFDEGILELRFEQPIGSPHWWISCHGIHGGVRVSVHGAQNVLWSGHVGDTWVAMPDVAPASIVEIVIEVP